MSQLMYINVTRVSNFMHISLICTKTNHGTGVAVNSGTLLYDLMKMGSDIAARYIDNLHSRYYQFC